MKLIKVCTSLLHCVFQWFTYGDALKEHQHISVLLLSTQNDHFLSINLNEMSKQFFVIPFDKTKRIKNAIFFLLSFCHAQITTKLTLGTIFAKVVESCTRSINYAIMAERQRASENICITQARRLRNREKERRQPTILLCCFTCMIKVDKCVLNAPTDNDLYRMPLHVNYKTENFPPDAWLNRALSMTTLNKMNIEFHCQFK